MHRTGNLVHVLPSGPLGADGDEFHFVVGDADPAELIQYVAEQLSVHKRPREVRRVSALPRNAMGKVVKKELMS